MIDTLLVAAAATLATALVPVAMMLAWGLSGGDGLQPNHVAPLAGMVVFLSSIAAWATTLGLLASPWGFVLAAGLIGGVVAWAGLFTAYPDDRHRRRIVAALVGAAVLLPVVVAGLGESRAPTPSSLLIAATPMLAAAVGLLAYPDRPRTDGAGGDRWATLLAGAPFVGVPALQAAAWLLD